MQAHGPARVGHIGPLVLVKPGGVLKFPFGHIQGEAFVAGVQRQGLPRYGKQLVTHAQESAERQNCVGNAPGVHVQQNFLDVAQVVACGVVNIVANEGVSPHEPGAGAMVGTQGRVAVLGAFVDAVGVSFEVVHMRPIWKVVALGLRLAREHWVQARHAPTTAS